MLKLLMKFASIRQPFALPDLLEIGNKFFQRRICGCVT